MARKKYYQGAKDRRDESRGMKKAMRRKYDSDKMERRKEGGMISEDRGSMANMPREVMMKEYPRFGYGMNEGLNDTIAGIDRQMYDDMHKEHKDARGYPEKY